MIRVVNMHYHQPTKDDIYIGRGSPLGNPYSHMSNTKAEVIVGSREEAIEAYRLNLKHQLENNNQLIKRALNQIAERELQGKDTNLVCFCHPHDCHGDVVKTTIEQAILARGK